MNNDRRKTLRGAIKVLEAVQAEVGVLAVDETQTGQESTDARDARIKAWQSRIEDAHGDVQSAAEEEQDYFDNMPESLQVGDKGSTAEEAVDSLGEACGSLEELYSLDKGAYGTFNEMWHEKYDDVVSLIEGTL